MSGRIEIYDETLPPVIELCFRDKDKPPPAITIERPVWGSIESAIHSVFDYGGFVRITVISPDTSYVRQLSMKALPGVFTLTVLTRSTDPKKELLEWWEDGEEDNRGLVRFGDDEFDIRMVCSKIDVAVSIFREIFECGDLVIGLQNMRSQWEPKQ